MVEVIPINIWSLLSVFSFTESRILDRLLEEEIERIHDEEIALCKKEDRNEPEWSNTLEMLLRKGVRS